MCKSTLALDDHFTSWIDFTSVHIIPNVTTTGLNCSNMHSPSDYVPPAAAIANFSSKVPLIPDVLSTFEYRWQCSDVNGGPAEWAAEGTEPVHIPIDPLAGPMRDPRICKNHGFYEPSKEYFVVDPWHLHNVARSFVVRPGEKPLVVGSPLRSLEQPRYLYFDVGASTWLRGAGGPSMPFFVGLVENRCAKLDGIWGWEVAQENPQYVSCCQLVCVSLRTCHEISPIPSSPS